MILFAVMAAVAYLALLLLKAFLALAYARTLPASDARPLAAGEMTVVQALLSGDPLLESRLAANLVALPDQPFLWLVDEGDREAARIADVLAAAHPAAALRVEPCPRCPDNANPKLWKLVRAAAIVRTPFFCVLDDDTSLAASSAAALAAAAATHTVATGLPCYLISGGLPSGLLSQFVNNNSVFTYMGTSMLLRPFTLNGMGYVLRSEEVAGVASFEPILHELTDDLALATLVLKQGGSICQSSAPMAVQTGVRNLSQYFQLMHRWHVFALLLVRRQRAPVQALIFVLHGLPPIFLAATLLAAAASAKLAAFSLVLAVLGTRLLALSFLHRRFFGWRLHRPALSILSELLQPVHLAHALACRTIRWRTRRYLVRSSGDFTAL